MPGGSDVLLEAEKIMGKEKEKEAEVILELIRAGTADSFAELPRETTTSAPSTREQSLYLDQELCDTLAKFPHAERDNFVQYFLTAIGHNRGSQTDVIKEASLWINANRANETERTAAHATDLKIRFSDGIDHAKSLEGLNKIQFWEPSFTPDCSVREMAEMLEKWNTPKGFCWSKDEVADVITVQNIEWSETAQGERTAMPIFIYTSAMYRKVLWAVWVPSQDRWAEMKYHADLERDFNSTLRTLTIKSKKALREIAASNKVKMEHVNPSPVAIKDRFYSLDGLQGRLASGDPYYLIRSTNEYDSIATIKNSVAWVSRPEVYFKDSIFGIDAHMPPSRVFEYLESRPRDKVTSRVSWNCHPIGTAEGDSLIKDCYAEPNQSRYNESLHQRFIQLLDNTPSTGDTAPLWLIMNEKLKDCGQKPTPQDIAHAIELQELKWGTDTTNPRTFIVGLSGFPRLIVDRHFPHACTNLFRVYHECIEQPYHLLNATMRNVQSDTAQVFLDIRSSKYRGTYQCKQRNQRTGKPVPMFQTRTNHRVAWKENETWCITHSSGKSEYHVDYEDCKLRIGDWMLDDVRPLMWYLEKALESIPAEDEVVKSYRGLADVTLARDIYSPGGLVMWGAYSSSSADQATATWFAMQEGSAAVFTLRGRSCKMIARYSRFAREMEYLYPPNICFQVKTMLTEDQQQILGREGLQLYELDEVDDLEALSIYITQNINAAITGKGMGLVDQLVTVIQALVNKELLDALAYAVAPSRPLIREDHGMEIARRLTWLSEANASPADSENVITVLHEALISAARDGHCDAVEKLIQLGADPEELGDGWHPVEHALMGGHLNVVQLLLRHTNLGTETDFVSQSDAIGNTPLHKMAEAGHEKAVILLLRLGADPLLKNKQNQAPAELAFAAKHTELVHLLKPGQVLGEAEMVKMRKYWRMSHYSSDDRKFRFTEPMAGGGIPYGVKTSLRVFDKQAMKEDVFKVAEGLKLWRTPKGLAWENDAVNDLVEDAKMMVSRKEGIRWHIAVPLFIHTASIYHTTLWGVWESQPERVSEGWWKVINATHPLEAAFKANSTTLSFNEEAKTAISRALSNLDEPPSTFHLIDGPRHRGLYGYVDRPSNPTLTLFRFRASEVQARSFSSCVAWLPSAEIAFTGGDSLPQFSILEAIYSRTANEPLKGKDAGRSWECQLAPLKDLPDLVRMRFKSHNPQSSDLQFYQEIEQRINKLNNRVVAKIFKAKVQPRNAHDDDVTPTLEMVSQALDLQVLAIRDGQTYVLALTGPKKLIAYETSKSEIVVQDVHRLCRHMGNTPSEYVDITTANVARDKVEIKLEVEKKSAAEFAGTYYHVSAGDEESTFNQSRRRRRAKGEVRLVPSMNGSLSFSEGDSIRSGSTRSLHGSVHGSLHVHAGQVPTDFDVDAEEFRRRESPFFSARWSRRLDCWVVQGTTNQEKVSTEETTLHLGTFMSSYVQPLMSSIQRALADMMIASRAPPLYRASLNPDLGHDTAVTWSTMTSASESYTMVESMFKADEQATIFTLQCTSALSISECSRFGREMEWAIPPNCVFERKNNKLIEANDTRALSLFIQDKISLLSAKTLNSEVINQLLCAKQQLNQNNVQKALELVLDPVDPDRPLIEDDDGLRIAQKLLKCGSDKSAVTRALHNAAREGYYKCIEHLMQLGADANARENNGGKTPVELAILGGHEKVIKHLRSDAPATSIVLPDVRAYAAEGEDLAVLLIHTLEKSEGRPESVHKMENGKYPIHLANQNGHTYTVYLLKSLMAEVGRVLTDIESSHTMPLVKVLRQAIDKGKSKPAMALLKRLDEVTGVPGEKNCLHFASQRFTSGHGIKVLKELARKGPSLINRVDQFSWTPLRYAVDAGNTQGVNILLEAGANPYIADRHGNPITCQIKTDGTIRNRLHDYFEERWSSASTTYKILRSEVKERLEELASLFLQNQALFQDAKREYLFWKDDKGSINKVCYNFIANGPKEESVADLDARITRWRSKFDNSPDNVADHEEMKRVEIERLEEEALRSIKADFEAELRYMIDMNQSVASVGKKEVLYLMLYYANPMLLAVALLYVFLSVPYFLFSVEDATMSATLCDAVTQTLLFVNLVRDTRLAWSEYLRTKCANSEKSTKKAVPSKSIENTHIPEREQSNRAALCVPKKTLLDFAMKVLPCLPLRIAGGHPALRLHLLLGITHIGKVKEIPIIAENVLQMCWVLLGSAYVAYITALVQMAVGGGMCRRAATPEEWDMEFWQCAFTTLRFFAGWEVHHQDTKADDAKMVVATLLAVVALFVRVIFVAGTIRLVETRDTRKKAYRERVREVADVLTHTNPEIQNLALSYYRLAWRKRGTVDLVQTPEVLTPFYPLLGHMVESAIAIEAKMKIPLFRNITIDRLAGLMPSLQYILAPKGVEFFMQGDESTHMYFLLSGTAGVRHSGKNIAVLGKGEYFGEVGLVMRRKRNATVVAVEDCELYQLGEEAFNELLSNKDVHSEIIKVAGDRGSDPAAPTQSGEDTLGEDTTVTAITTAAHTGNWDLDAVVSLSADLPLGLPLPQPPPPRDVRPSRRQEIPRRPHRRVRPRATSHTISISNPLVRPQVSEEIEGGSNTSSLSIMSGCDEEVSPVIKPLL